MTNCAIHLLSVVLTVLSVVRADTITTFAVPSGLDAPEGVSTSPNSPYFFTAGSVNGTIFRGTFDSPVLEPFIPADTLPGFKVSYGQKLLPNGNLILAGGPSGNVYVVSTTTKTLLHHFNNGLAPDKTLINDVAVDEETGDIYATDTIAKCVWRVKGSDIGEGAPTVGSAERWVEIPGWFSAPNGVVVVPDGYVIIGDLFGACLWTVNTATKEVVRVDTGLLSLIGFPDGLLYSAPYLYAVNGLHPGDLSLTEFITVIELLPPYKSGEIVGRIKNPLLDQPSTIAFVPGTNNSEFLAVNYQVLAFEKKLPYTIVRIPAKWQ